MAKEKEEKKLVKKEKTNKKTTKKKEQTKKNDVTKTTIRKEMKLVKWPTLKEIVKYTIATLIFCLIFVAFFKGLEFLMALVKGLFN